MPPEGLRTLKQMLIFLIFINHLIIKGEITKSSKKFVISNTSLISCYAFPESVILWSAHANIAQFLLMWQKHLDSKTTLKKWNKRFQGNEAEWVIVDFILGEGSEPHCVLNQD
jgi:hypothetical protein